MLSGVAEVGRQRSGMCQQPKKMQGIATVRHLQT